MSDGGQTRSGMSGQRNGVRIGGPERGSELTLSHSELDWDPSTLQPTPALFPEESHGKGHVPRLRQRPPTFSILASDTSIKMLNFLTAARPFSRAMIHLSMFFPRGQDTQSIILVRGVTVTQGQGRPKSQIKGSPGTGRKVLTHACTPGSVGTLLKIQQSPADTQQNWLTALQTLSPTVPHYRRERGFQARSCTLGLRTLAPPSPTGDQGKPLVLSEPGLYLQMETMPLF